MKVSYLLYKLILGLSLKGKSIQNYVFAIANFSKISFLMLHRNIKVNTIHNCDLLITDLGNITFKRIFHLSCSYGIKLNSVNQCAM